MPSTKNQLKPTAQNFLSELKSLDKTRLQQNTKYYTEKDTGNKIMGIVMSELFGLAKVFTPMPINEIEKLLENNFYEARMGAVCIMDFQARDKKTSPERRKELYALYIDRHDRINNWDMVDRSAPYVVGGYLFDKSRAPLYKLAKSKNTNERRTSIVATYFFIRQNDVNDTFKIAEILVHDKDDLVNKAVGSWIREAGKRDEEQLIGFLDRFAGTMPRVTLRYAVEKFDKKVKEHYLKI